MCVCGAGEGCGRVVWDSVVLICGICSSKKFLN